MHLIKNFQYILAAIPLIVINCSPPDQRLFDDIDEQETVIIYLNKYHLDGVPREIGKLRRAKSLSVMYDSTGGWTIYPPLSGMQQIADFPPFQYLPDEITELKNLHKLDLIGLNLRTLPENFGELEMLDSLDLLANKLTISNELEKLKKLKNLKYLGLFGNKYDSTDIKELKRANPRLSIFYDFE
jgi:hypothetical protein